MNANQIRDALKKLETYDQVAEFFGSLGYDFAGDAPVSTSQWPDSLRENKLRPKYMAQLGEFKVIYCELPGERMLRSLQRPILDQLARGHDFFMVVFHNKDQKQQVWWDFVNVRVVDGDTSPRRLARRISVGPSEQLPDQLSDRLYTASSRLEHIDINQRQNITLLDLQLLHNEAFDVEKVTKEFYNQYVAVFETFVDDIARLNPEHDRKWVDDQAQILLDRLMFLYFIQKKGWLNNEVDYLYRRFVKGQHAESPEDITYYQNDIQPLFLKLARSEQAQASSDAIPFLNGGLFQFDAQHMVMNLRVSNKAFKFAFDTLFEKYAFTVEEDMADDRAVAIDPEMLGKVFENLILSHEQDSDKRKATGSYYTPRTIVSFMCQQSLLEYLLQAYRERPDAENTPDPDEAAYAEAIQQFVEQNQVSDVVVQSAPAIREALLSVRVIDPAVGSGAFLVGMLQEILQLVRLLDEKTNYRTTTLPNYTYDLKRDIIGKCLYGVDLQEQAVQICELRLWLSLVVDYEPKEAGRSIKEWIRDIAPLPNLSYLVRQGNSLIEEVMGETTPLTFDDPRTLARMYQIKPLIHRMQERKAVYYRATEPDEKRRLNREMLSLQAELVIQLLTIRREDVDSKLPQTNDMFGRTLSRKEQQERDALTAKKTQLVEAIREANAIRSRADALKPAMNGFEEEIEKLRNELGSFLWRVDFGEVFGDRGGFDIAIANPPYIRQEKIQESKDHLQTLFKDVYTGTADLFVYFFAQALKLLRPNGVMTFITPNKFLRASYGKPLRTHLAQKTSLELLIDFGDLPVFEATTYPFITMARKQIPTHDHSPRTLIVDDVASLTQLTEAARATGTIAQTSLREDGWQLSDTQTINLMNKLRGTGIPLKEYVNEKIFYGIKTGYNEAFEIDSATKTRLIEQDARSAELIRPWLRGRDIKRWHIKPTNLWLIFTRRGTRIDDYPAIRAHLEQFRTQLTPGSGRKPGSYQWYEIQDNIAYYEEFDKPKIIYQEIATYQSFAFTREPYLTNNKCFIIPTEDIFLLGILNSKVTWFFLGQIASKLQGGAYAMQSPYVNQIPIPNARAEQRQHIETLVNQLLDTNTKPNVIKQLEQKLNQAIYALYNLTDEEINLIERSVNKGTLLTADDSLNELTALQGDF